MQNRYPIHDIADEDLQLNQKRMLPCKIGLNDLYDRIRMDPWFAKQKVMNDESAILIKTDWSFFGWGDEIRIIADLPFEQTQSIMVQSQPRYPKFATVDYGTNWENILRIKKILECEL